MGMDNALGSLGGFYGSIIGDLITQGERKRRQQSIYDERDLYGDLPANLRAEQEQLTELGPSAYESLSMDPAGRELQMDAARRTQAIADAGGMDPQFRAMLAQSGAAGAQQDRAQRGATLDSFARRGAVGSPGALVASLVAGQGGVQRAGMEGIQGAGQAGARQYQAIADLGAQGGAIRGADYQQAGDRAAAMDRVSQYNATQRQAVNARNTGSRNQFALNNADLAYRRAGMVGGTYGAERDYLTQEERRKRGLASGTGESLGRNVGTGADLMYGGR
jgi:hypothetical protein